LIALSIYVFIKELQAPDFDLFINTYALIPSSVSLSDPYTLINFVTAIFLHGGFLHIISNMWFLWIFGDNVEGYLGKFYYLLLFLLAGIVGNVVQFFVNYGSSVPMIGASGAVSGILGAYYILFPHSRIRTLLFIFFFVTVVDIPAVVYLFYWFILQFFSGIASFSDIATGGIAFWAHVGGFITGVFFAKAFQEKESGFIEGEIVE